MNDYTNIFFLYENFFFKKIIPKKTKQNNFVTISMKASRSSLQTRQAAKRQNIGSTVMQLQPQWLSIAHVSWFEINQLICCYDCAMKKDAPCLQNAFWYECAQARISALADASPKTMQKNVVDLLDDDDWQIETISQYEYPNSSSQNWKYLKSRNQTNTVVPELLHRTYFQLPIFFNRTGTLMLIELTIFIRDLWNHLKLAMSVSFPITLTDLITNFTIGLAKVQT